MKLLLVDDDKTILNVLKDYFSVLGYDVLTTLDGEDAFKTYKRVTDSGDVIDFVVSDIYMPVMNGIDFYYLVRENGFKGGFVFITGFYTDLNEEKLKKDGVLKVFYKPLTLKDLAETIEAHLKL